jgi:hypothetical protein
VDAWGLGCLIQEVYSGSPLARTEDLRNTGGGPAAAAGAAPGCRWCWPWVLLVWRGSVAEPWSGSGAQHGLPSAALIFACLPALPPPAHLAVRPLACPGCRPHLQGPPAVLPAPAGLPALAPPQPQAAARGGGAAQPPGRGLQLPGQPGHQGQHRKGKNKTVEPGQTSGRAAAAQRWNSGSTAVVPRLLPEPV